MRVLTGDECGLLKEFLPSQVSKKPSDNANAASVVTDDGIRRINATETMSRGNAVVGLTWMPEDHHFAALRVDGTVQVWEGTYESGNHGVYRPNVEIPGVFSSQEQAEEDDRRRRRAIGIHSWSSHNRLVACDTEGTIAVVNPFTEDQDKYVVNLFATFETKNSTDNNKSTIQTTAFALNNQGVAAVGAKDRECVLWDVTTGKQLWKTKNLPPDPQTLLQPRVWPTAATFIDDNLLAVGSAYHQVRIYDVRMDQKVQQRRPIKYTDEKNAYLEHRVTALCALSTTELVVGDAGGYLQSLDLRQLSGGANVKRTTATPVVGRFVGPAGSVRQLALSKDNNRLICVGLDRMLRIYNTTTRKQLQTVYLKQRLNCVLVTDEVLAEEDDDIDQEDNVQDYVNSDEKEQSNDEQNFDGDDDDVVEDIDGVPEESSASEDSSDDANSGDDRDESSGSEEEEETSPRKRRKQ